MNAAAVLDRSSAACRKDKPWLQALLARWAEYGWLRQLDAAFAEFLWREVPEAPPLAILAAALASHQLGRGHACLDLAATLDNPAFALSLPPEGGVPGSGGEAPPLPAEVLAGLSLGDWQAALDVPVLVGEGAGDTPLVHVGGRLYLRRYWRYEEDVRAGIGDRLAGAAALMASLPAANLNALLARLFPPDRGHDSIDWQKIACALAARSAVSIITGGPGTGKTTTVVRLLALLQALALQGPDGRALRIRLSAPTGKAAARLAESIAGAIARLPLEGLAGADAMRAAIPATVTTIHRLLGSRPDTRRFRHHAGNPLALDVLVIDEASMVDLEMMAAVLAALPPSARLVMLGDKDQLASVEAGAVLGELCARAAAGHYTPETRDWLKAVTGEVIDPSLVDAAGEALDQSIAMLRHSHRFGAGSGIGQLAAAVNSGDPAAVAEVLRAGHRDLSILGASAGNDAFAALVIDGHVACGSDSSIGQQVQGYRHYLTTLCDRAPAPDAGPAAFDAWARAVLEAHGAFQVLCALRRGAWGVEGLNRRIAQLLHEAGLIPASEGWYPGRPVLVTRNDYALGLMNGDIGITLAYSDGGARDPMLRVAFPAGDGNGIKWVLPSRLQAVETVFALTVHKSQGSEFAHAALVLPETLNPILTRELLYTGITRARNFLTLINAGSDRLIAEAVRRKVLRAGGLSKARG